MKRTIPLFISAVTGFVLIATAFIVLGALWLLFRHTRFGVLVRAATEDREMVAALGIDQRWLFTGAFILGAALAGLGGALLLAADIPVLFTVNFRLIQQVAASYGFPLRGPEYTPLVVGIFNVAASGSREAKSDALRELSVAAAAFAHGSGYKGRKVQGTLREQIGHVPREIAKNLGAAKLGQMIPIAGAAVGAGVNYWFTDQTAQATMMLARALYLERKERM